MKTVDVNFSVLVPEEATDQEIEDWLNFGLGATAQLSGGGPLVFSNLNAVFGSVRISYSGA